MRLDLNFIRDFYDKRRARNSMSDEQNNETKSPKKKKIEVYEKMRMAGWKSETAFLSIHQKTFMMCECIAE